MNGQKRIPIVGIYACLAIGSLLTEVLQNASTLVAK